MNTRSRLFQLAAYLLMAAILPACDSAAPPPTHHRIELSGYGILLIDIEMVDTWEKNYLSKFTFEPETGGKTELIVERYGGKSLPRIVNGNQEKQLLFDQMNLEPLVILAEERIILRLPQSRHGSERLIVRAGTDDWRRYDFDDASLSSFPIWTEDIRPSDIQHGGFSELVHVDIPSLRFTFYRHGGYLVRELQFRISRDGRSIGLVDLQHAPLEVRNRGRLEPEWASAVLLRQIEKAFHRESPTHLDLTSHWRLDDIRIVAFYACPASTLPDRLYALFGLRKLEGATFHPAADDTKSYRRELWRFDRIDEHWRSASEKFFNPTPFEIMQTQKESFGEVRECHKVY